MDAAQTHVHDQVKAEIKETILGALETVALEKCPKGYYIDPDNFSRFLKIIRIKQIQGVGECFVPGQLNVEENNLPNEHQFPGHPSRRGREGYSVQGRGAVGINLNPEVVPVVTVGGGANVGFDVHNEQNFVEEPVPIPAGARMEHRKSCAIHSHKIFLTVQADFNIRIYCAIPVKTGAAAGGGTGAAVGAVGGAVGGAALGALIGSVVPGAGTLIGGVIGGVVGGIGGTVGGGGAVAGVGAGIGFAHSKNTYKTVQAVEVFRKLEEFSCDQTHNNCCCTVIGNTTCPHQEHRLNEGGQ